MAVGGNKIGKKKLGLLALNKLEIRFFREYSELMEGDDAETDSELYSLIEECQAATLKRMNKINTLLQAKEGSSSE